MQSLAIGKDHAGMQHNQILDVGDLEMFGHQSGVDRVCKSFLDWKGWFQMCIIEAL